MQNNMFCFVLDLFFKMVIILCIILHWFAIIREVYFACCFACCVLCFLVSRPTNIMFSCKPGGHTNNSVVHMRDQRNTKKKGGFETWRANRDRSGVKMCLFLRKGVLLDSINGRLGVIFWTRLNMSSKRAYFRGIFGGRESREILV